jgi:hypothetical protein
MSRIAAAIVLWTARVAGVAVSAFLVVSAFDALNGGWSIGALADLLIHLAPAALVLAVVMRAWRTPIVGAAAFPILALGYAVMAGGRIDWIVAIAGPLAIVGVLFLVSWGTRAMAAADAP